MFRYRRSFVDRLGWVLAIAFLPAIAAAQNVSLVGKIAPFPSSHRYGDIWAEGNIACIGVFPSSNAYGVGIIDISNADDPVLITNYFPSPSNQNQFQLGALRDGIGFFGSWNGGGVHVVSLADPANPLLLARIGRTTGTVTNGHDRVHTLFVDGAFLYTADHVTRTVKVFDISLPAAPVFVRNIVATDADKIHQITVKNNRLFTSGWGGRTDIYDVTHVGTQHPPLLGVIESGLRSHSSWPTEDGNYLVTCREISGGDVKIYDISDPASPELVALLNPANVGIKSAMPHNPVVIGDLLYVSWYQAGLQIFDISNPARPVRVGSYDSFPGPITTSFEGNWGVYPFLGIDKILLSDMQSGLIIVDASAVLTATENYPPLILSQPQGQTVEAGESVTFAVDATGSSLDYQWRLNGEPIAGATGSSYTIDSVQANEGGAYSVAVSNGAGSLTSQNAGLTVLVPEIAILVFSDDFDSPASEGNWDLFEGSSNNVPDYTVDWSFDYSAYFSVYNGTTIPPAPNTTNGTTRGVRLTVNNNDATGRTAAVSLYPKGHTFDGAYRLKVDMWMNYPGGPGGTGSGIQGSTETATFGLNHHGTRVNWQFGAPSDGVFFGVHGEGGVNEDYRAYVGNPSAAPTWLILADSGLVGVNNTEPVFQSIFPSPQFETAGAPGKQWVEVELMQDSNNVITWRMNGHLIAQRTNTSSFISGKPMIGYMDLFNSIANPAADAFVIFDNVRVEIMTEAVPPSIVAQPEDQIILPEEDATFAVVVTGSAPFTYQWRFNAIDIPGATASAYTRENAEPEHVGNYSVMVSNVAGHAVSSNATLTLINAPEISDVRAVAGSRSAIIAWTTDLPANSQVEFDFHTPHGQAAGGIVLAGHGKYNQVSYLGAALVYEHRVLLTGLQPDTDYGFQVISRTEENEYLSAGYHFRTTGDDEDNLPPGTVPLWWAEFYFGEAADGFLDHDSDGFTTAEEFWLGTDPTDPDSRLQFAVETSGGNVLLSVFPINEGRQYHIQNRADLSGGEWTDMAGLSSTTDVHGRRTFVIPNGNVSGFYRVSAR